MTIGQMNEQVARLINPANPAQSIGSAAIANFLFDAMCEAAQSTKLFKLRTTTSINYDSTNSFYMPSDMLQLLELCVAQPGQTNPRPAERATQEKVDAWLFASPQSITQGYVGQYFYSLGSETTAGASYGKDKFALYAPPTSTVTNGITFRYLRFPKHPSVIVPAEEVVDFPKTFHLALCYEAAWLFLSAQSVRHIKDFAGYHKFFADRLATLQQNFDEDSLFDKHGGQWGFSWGGVADKAFGNLP